MSEKRSYFNPDYAIHPGESLQETLAMLGMSQAELAERTGRPRKTINEIIAGKAAITAETALQMERVLGVPASFWTNLERNYREILARLKEEEELRGQLTWLGHLPLSVMVRYGWIPQEDTPLGQLKTLLNFFGVAGVTEWRAIWEGPAAAFRHSAAFQVNPFAVAAWLRKGELDARSLPCEPWSDKGFKRALHRIRAQITAEPAKFIPLMIQQCSRAGVAVAFTPELPGTRLYGATRWINSRKAILQLSFRGKTDDYFWFTFFHEAAHLLLHGKRDSFIDAPDSTNDKNEQEADWFAQDFLIDPRSWRRFVVSRDFKQARIRQFAREINVSPGIIVGRLQHEQKIPFSSGNSMKRSFQLVSVPASSRNLGG